MQTFDPKKRITVEDALAHPYLEAYVRTLHLWFRYFGHRTHGYTSMIQMTSPLRHPSILSSLSSIVSSQHFYRVTTMIPDFRCL